MRNSLTLTWIGIASFLAACSASPNDASQSVRGPVSSLPPPPTMQKSAPAGSRSAELQTINALPQADLLTPYRVVCLSNIRDFAVGDTSGAEATLNGILHSGGWRSVGPSSIVNTNGNEISLTKGAAQITCDGAIQADSEAVTAAVTDALLRDGLTLLPGDEGWQVEGFPTQHALIIASAGTDRTNLKFRMLRP